MVFQKKKIQKFQNIDFANFQTTKLSYSKLWHFAISMLGNFKIPEINLIVSIFNNLNEFFENKNSEQQL